jgi:Ca2+-transporting ATPase
MLYYNQSVTTTLKELDTTSSGLSKTDASERLSQYGLNQISVAKRSLFSKIIEPFANVFMGVLFVAVIISILYGERLDAIIIGAIIAVNVTIAYIQQFSTDRILRSLERHTAQLIEVLRDGRTVKIDISMLVPGDIMMLAEGDRIPADARLIKSESVRTDESSLTGESVPMNKSIEELTGEIEAYEQSNMLFHGSFIVSGNATAVVVATGNDTQFGKLASLTKGTTGDSPVQTKIDKLISYIIIIVVVIGIIAFVLDIIHGAPVGEALRFVIALSVSAVPESLPVAISVILVLGMRRMAAKKALISAMHAIETIGVVTTIATDKTGTLTENTLTVKELWTLKRSTKTLANDIAHSTNHGVKVTYDPLDIAFKAYSDMNTSVQPHSEPLVALSFNQTVAMSGNIWHHGDMYKLVVKGAPEHVIKRSKLTPTEREQAETELHRLTSLGYRVIALASSPLQMPVSSLDDLPSRLKLSFSGFVAVSDVLRHEAKSAIAAATDAGVTVRMITGDHLETAYHIGTRLGLVTGRDQVFDSRKMHTMSDEALLKKIDTVRIFSRVVPENKYRILALLKQTNITAMTGDGVNDVPALTNAHVGVAMGSGSQIAKDAGDIILLDNNFKSIIEAIREGRIIFANIRHMLFYLLSTSAGEAITMVGSLALGLPIPLLPVQILWVNLVTDTAMVIPLGLEPGEKGIMKRRPRRPDAPILSPFMISRVILIAFAMAITAIGMYIFFTHAYGEQYARTITFSALVVMQWANAFNARSDYQSLFSRLGVWNGKFYAGLLIAIILQIMVLFGPLQSILQVTPVALGDLYITSIIAFAVPVVLVELHKFIGRRLFMSGKLKAHSI